ncbi:hypothetical protein [Edaphobacter aggregans]|uniref:hypothetical protein n=1 Tax=Edaphobacter aggregans TaxID=570835 RepID=UPI00055842D9|nr:hypothetical protein [Edaphobacter aggregans]
MRGPRFSSKLAAPTATQPYGKLGRKIGEALKLKYVFKTYVWGGAVTFSALALTVRGVFILARALPVQKSKEQVCLA